MFNIIELLIILTATFTPQQLKPIHLKEYDLIGEIPEILITATKPSVDEMRAIGIMPEIEVTATKITNNPKQDNNGSSRFSEAGMMPLVEVFASKSTTDEMNGMMPEVIITAERIKPNNGHIVQETKKTEKGG